MRAKSSYRSLRGLWGPHILVEDDDRLGAVLLAGGERVGRDGPDWRRVAVVEDLDVRVGLARDLALEYAALRLRVDGGLVQLLHCFLARLEKI